ncbi:MAG: S8 family serine peptidase [Proteobacteria bacterium]|nr:S8 family serine peptidase [Pseudomonadota bacterium]
MRSKLMAAAAVAASVLFGSVSALAQGAPANLGVSVDLREEVRDSFIFVFTDDVASTEVRGQANRLVRGQGGSLTFVYTTALKGFAAKMPADAAARLAAQNPNIDYYEPDGVVFAFPKPPWARGGSDEETAACDPQVTPWGIERVGGPGDGLAVIGIAWVIDTGIDLDHPDLNVDVELSANFVWRGKNSPNDGNGHGTHVAGTIAAIDNSCDVVGVAAGAWVVAVRVLDNSGSGSYSGVIAGVDYVAANAQPGDVANLSLGGPYYQPLNDAIWVAAEDYGIYFALAAGNSSDDAEKYSPASANHTKIYTVSAIAQSVAVTSKWGEPEKEQPGHVRCGHRGAGERADPDGDADPICHKFHEST